jgi:hypothetical protein
MTNLALTICVARQRGSARRRAGDLLQIKQMLGHASIVTTDRYLGSGQEIGAAVNNNLGI